jgi:heptaprenyl diphosphate synthase
MSKSALKPYDRILELLADDLERFDKKFTEVLDQQKDLLTENELGLYKRGKKVRPMLLMLSARMNSIDSEADVEDKIIAAAVSLEIAHIGSLIHDDIVDKAPLRRGLPTFNASRGYEFALLIGDLQIMESARVFASFVNNVEDIQLMKEYLDTGYTLCKGQIEDLVSESMEWDPKAVAQRYYRIIDRKTGRLIAFACEAGARLSGATPSQVKAMRTFGMFLGRAFQIMDDVLDVVSPTDAAGKEIFTDLREGRLSLPIIYAMDNAPEDHVINKVVNGHDYSEEEFEAACRYIKDENCHIKAYSDARVSVEEAKTELYHHKENKYKEAMIDLVNYIVDRGYN